MYGIEQEIKKKMKKKKVHSVSQQWTSLIGYALGI